MGQQEIFELLEGRDEPLARREIAELLEITEISVSLIIRKLLKHNDVDFIELDKNEAMRKFNCKRRMRLYFVKKDITL